MLYRSIYLSNQYRFLSIPPIKSCKTTKGRSTAREKGAKRRAANLEERAARIRKFQPRKKNSAHRKPSFSTPREAREQRAKPPASLAPERQGRKMKRRAEERKTRGSRRGARRWGGEKKGFKKKKAGSYLLSREEQYHRRKRA